MPLHADDRPLRAAVSDRIVRRILPSAISLLVLSGCSIQTMAVNRIGDALAQGGTTFAADDDPDLVGEALPFSLKLMESLLAESPDHRGLLTATASGFTLYAYGFVERPGDEIASDEPEEAEYQRGRARRLYLRAKGYGLRGLDVAHPGFSSLLASDARAAVLAAKKDDVPLLYWTAASWGLAISLALDDPDMVADFPLVEALIDRALELDESWDGGTLHAFLVTYEQARMTGSGTAAERSQAHFDRAVQLSGGMLASPYVALAEAVTVKEQDHARFRELLETALAIDVDNRPEWRLANLLAQRRAQFLLDRIDELFLLEEDPGDETDPDVPEPEPAAVEDPVTPARTAASNQMAEEAQS